MSITTRRRLIGLLALAAFLPGTGCRKPLPPPDYLTLAEDTGDESLFAEDARGERIDLHEMPGPERKHDEEASGLQYLEVLTGGATHDERLPMIVAIHGMGSRPEIFARVFSLFHEKARILLPRGPQPLGHGFSWFSIGQVGAQYERMVAELEIARNGLGAFVRQASERHRTAGKPIVIGFSQGGMLTLALALHDPDAIGLAIPMAGWVPPTMVPGTREPMRPNPPIRLLHGEHDARLKIAWIRELAAQLQGKGFDVELFEYKGLRHTFSRNLWPELFTLLGRQLERLAGERAGAVAQP